MPEYSMRFAAAHLSDLIALAEAGEEVILARDGTPAARLVPVAAVGPRRQPGRLRDRIAVGPEFFEPLPEEELAAWEGR